MVKQKFGQNMPNKEKMALRNLIRAKMKSIVMNDTNKKHGSSRRRQNWCYFRMCQATRGYKNIFENIRIRSKTIDYRNPKSDTL